jgi:hypothetical protein
MGFYRHGSPQAPAVISRAAQTVGLLCAFGLGVMTPIPRGIGMGESFVGGGCCATASPEVCGPFEIESDEAAASPACSPCGPCSPCGALRCSEEDDASTDASADCERCVCCLCGIGVLVAGPELPLLEIESSAQPWIDDNWISITRPPASPPPETSPLLSLEFVSTPI